MSIDAYFDGKKVTERWVDTLGKICKALGCTIGELIEYQPDNKKPVS